MESDDGKVRFLHKVSTRTQPNNSEMRRIGSSTPLFRAAEQGDLSSLLGGTVASDDPKESAANTLSTDIKDEMRRSGDTVRAAVHMDAMAFGMGCCCLQITFQAKDVDESRFIYDQLAVMAPM